MFPHNTDHVNSALAVPARLQSLLREVEESLAQIAAHMARVAPAEIPVILAEHRGTFYRAMDALGGGIIDFLAENPSPDQIQAVRTQIAAPIRAWSATSSVFNRLLRSSARGPPRF